MWTPRVVTSLTALALFACGTKASPAEGPGARVEGKPVETKPPEAKGQTPAFAGQTRAPYRTANIPLETTVVASGLDHPWALTFLPDGAMLVTEKPGRLRIITRDGAKSPPLPGLFPVDARGQGGLLDVALDPAFDRTNLVYWSYAEPRDGANGTAVARGRLVRDANAPRIEDATVIWRMTPDLRSTMHFGSRLVFATDGTLFITTGERSIAKGRAQAQRLDSAFGKIIRVNPDGSIPKDNPFVGRPEALPEIYALGIRNVQAAALHPRTGELWEVEHGARGGDEINIIKPGKNYGWPTIAYGIEYVGDRIGEGKTAAPGMEQPIYYWDPVIAPSGMAFYEADLFPAWKGSLLVGGLVAKHIARLTLEGDRVVGEERLLAGRARIRDVKVGPDGAVYAVTDEDNGEILRITPGEAATRSPTASR